jgi:hypothetical protein
MLASSRQNLFDPVLFPPIPLPDKLDIDPVVCR